jgi:hypothetical protein
MLNKMKLREFIEKFSHNNLIRLHYKVKGGYKSALETDDDVSMDWEVLKGKGKNRHYIDNEVLGIISILYQKGSYTEAINIIIEKLDNQPFIDEVTSGSVNYGESI